MDSTKHPNMPLSVTFAQAGTFTPLSGSP